MTDVAERPTPAEQQRSSDGRTIGLGEYVRGYVRRLRTGNLGSLPIVLGLVVIVVIFSSLRETFLSPVNFTNLVVQIAGLATIALGVVFVLLLGEIDLSVGYVSGTGAAVMVRFLEAGQPWWVAVVAAVIAGAGIGLLHGLIITKARVPSFVVTLAGFLAWSGAVLILLTGFGTVSIQNDVIIGVANTFLPGIWGWLVAVAVVAGFAVVQWARARARRRQGLPTLPAAVLAARVAGLAALSFGAVWYLQEGRRGVPLVGVLVLAALVALSFIANRTRFGRHIYAVGGNAEAARRAGINVDRVRIACFMIASVMAVLGGIILASRLRSVSVAAGGGNLLLNAIAAAVIGGTSLFGGRGRVVDALLGALVIGAVDNGMGLLGLDAGVKFVVTGLILLAAVIVDSLSQRGRSQSGVA